jgi:hypothetical protein
VSESEGRSPMRRYCAEAYIAQAHPCIGNRIGNSAIEGRPAGHHVGKATCMPCRYGEACASRGGRLSTISGFVADINLVLHRVFRNGTREIIHGRPSRSTILMAGGLKRNSPIWEPCRG